MPLWCCARWKARNAEKIAAVPGIDVIFAASTDLGNFSGHKQGEPQYEALVTRIKEATLARGIKPLNELQQRIRRRESHDLAPLPERDVPDYIEADHGKMSAKLARIPAVTDVPYPVQMEPHLVVEYYSR